MGDLSANFSRAEFRCPDGCGRDNVDPNLVLVMQRLRNMLGSPLHVVSGVRCVRHNRRVGGIPNSEHLAGRAADIKRWQFRAVQALGAGAIGVGVRHGWVMHVDVTPGRRPFVFDE